MRKIFLALAILLLTSTSIWAQKTPPCQNDGPNAGNCGPAPLAPSGDTTSPIEPLKATDTRFVINAGSGLDTGCTYRPGGPLVISLPIKRVVGATSSNGTLQFANQMVANGVLSQVARLRMPAFDVDLEGAPGIPPELDYVLFNGVNIGSLSGSNNTWKLNEFNVPIDLVRFGTRNPGGEPTPGVNEITIQIDQGSGSEVNWCTAIDWAEISFKAVSPIILVHGNNQTGEFYEKTGFEAYLESLKLLYDHSIQLPPAPIYNNASRIDRQLPDIVKSFGVDSIHLVAHSKGGLDSRGYLEAYQPSHDKDFKVLSLNTLGTPHDGTILTDLLQARRDAAQMVGKLGRIEYINFPNWTRQIAAFASRDFDDGLQALTTKKVALFNVINVGSLPPDLSITAIGSDADINENGHIDREPDEYAGMRKFSDFLGVSDEFNSAPGRFAMNFIYQILRNSEQIKMSCCRTETVLGVPRRVATITAAPSTIAIPNDMLVTAFSATGTQSIGPRTFSNLIYLANQGRDHGTVADAGIAAQVVVWILIVEQTRGDLR